ncbi:hypothetical protein [Sphingobium sp. CR28]|uniref:hypothetical protein n=1 Tax=Sphingobium sp. CR28 TaxID=3400272 RepID=UPI003FEE3CC2
MLHSLRKGAHPIRILIGPAAAPDLASLATFAEHCRFLALATSNSDGYADLSPKGDPAGLIVKIEGNTLRFADRPGNKRIDSFRTSSIIRGSRLP